MESQVCRSLLRIFYQHQTNFLLYLRNGLLAGYIEKRSIEELMSDLAHAESIPEIPFQPLQGVEDILTILLQSSIVLDGKKAMPVADEGGNFIGLWSKSEIMQSLALKTGNQPAEPGERSASESPVESVSIPPVKFQFSKNVLEAASVKTPEPVADRNTPPEPKTSSHDYISLKTLEALPIPMLALDTKGDILFYNQDWVDLQKKNKDTLGVKILMNSTRDIMAKMAFDGNLEINSILEVPVSIKNHSIKMRSILTDGESISRVMGYVFWAETVVEKEVVPTGKTKKDSGQDSDSRKPEIRKSEETTDVQRQKYLGKTLVELLREEEKKIMAWAMDEANQNQSNAAMLLGIPRQTFSYRYHKLFDNSLSKKLK